MRWLDWLEVLCALALMLALTLAWLEVLLHLAYHDAANPRGGRRLNPNPRPNPSHSLTQAVTQALILKCNSACASDHGPAHSGRPTPTLLTGAPGYQHCLELWRVSFREH